MNDQNAYAKEIWTYTPHVGCQFLVSNKDETPIAPLVDTLFSIVKERMQHPKLNKAVMYSETYWYRQDVIINENGSNGIKGFTLKYYKWVDDNGEEVDPDNLPGTVKEIINPVPIDPDTGEPMRESFLYAKTYTLRPTLTDDTIIDDALPRYADFDASLYVFEDVEYLTETTNIIYDGTPGICQAILRFCRMNRSRLSGIPLCSRVLRRANSLLHGLRTLHLTAHLRLMVSVTKFPVQWLSRAIIPTMPLYPLH